MIGKVAAEAAREAAVAAAEVLHRGDPAAAALAACDGLQRALAFQINSGAGDSRGDSSF